MRGLQKQNVVIDAYVDLKEAAIKGTMTVKISPSFITERGAWTTRWGGQQSMCRTESCGQTDKLS